MSTASRRQTAEALPHATFRGVRITEADAAAGVLLSAEAGWNQTPEDWRLLLREGLGFGFEDASGTLVASAVLFPYGDRFAWIGMVLVSSNARRQKLATLLMTHLLQLADERAWIPLLDATADGRTVYLPLGFRDLRTITRWHRPARGEPNRTTLPSGVQRVDRIEAWAEWDAVRFGASRASLLSQLHGSAPTFAMAIASPDATSAGFCLARPGRLATEIGPIVADDMEVASSLLEAALAQSAGPLLIDLVDGQAALEARLESHGFVRRRHFVRMIRGEHPEPGRPAAIHAIVGPEFG